MKKDNHHSGYSGFITVQLLSTYVAYGGILLGSSIHICVLLEGLCSKRNHAFTSLQHVLRSYLLLSITIKSPCKNSKVKFLENYQLKLQIYFPGALFFAMLIIPQQYCSTVTRQDLEASSVCFLLNLVAVMFEMKWGLR